MVAEVFLLQILEVADKSDELAPVVFALYWWLKITYRTNVKGSVLATGFLFAISK